MPFFSWKNCLLSYVFIFFLLKLLKVMFKAEEVAVCSHWPVGKISHSTDPKLADTCLCITKFTLKTICRTAPTLLLALTNTYKDGKFSISGCEWNKTAKMQPELPVQSGFLIRTKYANMFYTFTQRMKRFTELWPAVNHKLGSHLRRKLNA